MFLPMTDQDARCVVANFKRDGIASLTADGMHYGFIRELGEEAYHQKDQGCRVSVGRDLGTNEWYVCSIDLPTPKAQGA